jgi:hypothetical protein
MMIFLADGDNRQRPFCLSERKQIKRLILIIMVSFRFVSAATVPANLLGPAAGRQNGRKNDGW